MSTNKVSIIWNTNYNITIIYIYFAQLGILNCIILLNILLNLLHNLFILSWSLTGSLDSMIGVLMDSCVFPLLLLSSPPLLFPSLIVSHNNASHIFYFVLRCSLLFRPIITQIILMDPLAFITAFSFSFRLCGCLNLIIHSTVSTFLG